MEDPDSRTIWCGNLSEKVTEELLYELFLQAAPLEEVRIPTDKNGRKANYGFIVVKHQVSVEYATRLLDGTFLFERKITVKPRKAKQNRDFQRHEEKDFFVTGQSPQAILDNLNPPYQAAFHRDRNYSKPYHRYDNQMGRNNWGGNYRSNYNDRHRRRYH